MKNLFLALSLVFTLQCIAQDPDPDLFQTWYLQDIFLEFGPPLFLMEPTIYAELTISETLDFSGNGSCNTFTGTFMYDPLEDTLEAFEFSRTNDACGFPYHDQFEDQYFMNVRGLWYYEISQHGPGQQLYIWNPLDPSATFTNYSPYAEIPMLQQGNAWSVDVYYELLPPCDPTPCSFTVTPQISLGNIELIDGVPYRRILSDGSPTCLLREDNGVVYKYDESSQIAKVLFDFNLELGDIFEIQGSAYDVCCSECTPQIYGSPGGDLTVIGVDFLELAGKMRKVITFDQDGYFGNFQWIEGIGNITGFDFMWEAIDITDGSLLVCFETEGISYFFNDATSCDNTTFSIDDFEQDQIVLYPNPSSSRVFIESKRDLITKTELHNLQGKEIRSFFESTDSIDITDLPSGIYFLRIFTEQGSTVKKIIKQ
jgi:hypothetical protein